MTDDMIDLGRRAVACKGWRWMEGMNCRWRSDPEPESKRWWAVRLADEWETWEVVRDGTWDGEPASDGPIPDLSDPATLGCLLALVREAWGCHVHLRRWANPAPDMSGKDRSTWEPVDGLGRRLVSGPRLLCATEAEALVAALEGL